MKEFSRGCPNKYQGKYLSMRNCCASALQDDFPLFSSLAFQGNSPDAPSNLPKLSCGIGGSHLVLFAAYGGEGGYLRRFFRLFRVSKKKLHLNKMGGGQPRLASLFRQLTDDV